MEQVRKKTEKPEIKNIINRKQNSPEVVQRYLIIGSIDYTRNYQQEPESLDEIVQQIYDSMIRNLRDNDDYEKGIKIYFSTDKLLVEKQIKKWVIDNVGERRADNKGNSTFGVKNQRRSYKSMNDAAKAIYGWVSSKPNRHIEKEVANIIYESPNINSQINTVFALIVKWIDTLDNKQNIISELNIQSKNSWADYISWFNYNNSLYYIPEELKLPSNIYDVICNPSNYTFRVKIAILHDLMKYFMSNSETEGQNLLQKLPELKATIGEKQREVYTRPENSKIPRNYSKPLDKLRKIKFKYGGLEDSKEEQNLTFIFARKHQIPMWGRHSCTAARMMKLVQQVGAAPEQISAVAWSIMAFWRKDYDHRTIPYHTLHEIMDFLPDFGGTYDPLAPYNGLLSFVDASKLIKLIEDSITKKPLESYLRLLSKFQDVSYVINFLLRNEELWENKIVSDYIKYNYSQNKSNVISDLWNNFVEKKIIVKPVVKKSLIFNKIGL